MTDERKQNTQGKITTVSQAPRPNKGKTKLEIKNVVGRQLKIRTAKARSPLVFILNLYFGKAPLEDLRLQLAHKESLFSPDMGGICDL